MIYEFADESGNRSTCTFNIIINPQEIHVKVSNVITPDGDGVNDIWMLDDIENFKDNVVQVVDRWGNMVYRGIGYDNSKVHWGGLGTNGSRVPTGTYFYAVELRVNQKVVKQTGYVEVIQ